ncbi:MAG TPA: hypothetical protein ENG95_00215 [Nitrospirae bacterium]|nr:hypothetical protein [Nitrospirota bacterium]
MKMFYSHPVIVTVSCFAVFCFLSLTAFAASDLEEGVSELAQQISKNMTETGKKKIAIIEFSDLDGNINAFGQFLAEELITKLFMISPGQFEVVERRQLMRVLQEQKLTMSGLLDAKAMESVGKILGIDAIVTGSVTDLGNTVKVNARLIGVDTAKVFAVATTSIPKVGTVEELFKKQAVPVQIYSSSGEQVVSQTLSTISPISSKSKKVGLFTITINRIIVSSKGQVRIMLDFFNQSDKKLKIARLINPEPNATDNKGNDFIFENGITYKGYMGWERDAQVLNSKSHNDLVLYLRPKDRDIVLQDIGNNFAFYFNYVLYNPKEKTNSNYSVSFTDIKAQKP